MKAKEKTPRQQTKKEIAATTLETQRMAGLQFDVETYSKTGYLSLNSGAHISAQYARAVLDSWCCSTAKENTPNKRITSMTPDYQIKDGQLVTIGMYFTYDY